VLDALSGAGGRVRMEGPRVALTSKNALSLSMAFHELGTNALKYGALNRSEGVVDLTWTSDGSRLAIEWRERGGPAVRAPERRGFGSRLLERGVAAELNGEVDLRFEADGLVCRIAAPLPADGSA
jgi:two-component sensor histidine kinase